MGPQDHLDALAREGTLLGEVRLADVDVPTCPGWTLADLVHHVGEVHRWQTDQLRSDDPGTLAPRRTGGARPDDADLIAWYRRGLGDLLATFDQVGFDKQTPTWSGPRPAAFWARRAAHETAVHRWDAQAAITRPAPLEADQAVDLIDEVLDVVAPRRMAANGWEGDSASLHLHCTDVDGEWTVELGPDGISVRREHAKGDVAARGHASDLALMLIGRLPSARLEVFGDASVLDRWHRSVPM
ncbi:MAG: maleylpyruvate isomerase family mycothiol-dependent enzyme [Acidimicrobiales bacterium]